MDTVHPFCPPSVLLHPCGEEDSNMDDTVQMMKPRSQDWARTEPSLPESRFIEGSDSRVIPTSQPQPRSPHLPTKGPQAWKPFNHVSHPGQVQLQRVCGLSLLSPRVPSSYPLLPTLSPLRSKDTMHNWLFLLIPTPFCTIS